jgi:hypothetical protein
MAVRLSVEARAKLEARRERLQFELRLIEGELRTDKALRLQAELRPADERPALPPGYPSAKFRNLLLGTLTGLPTASTRTAGSSLTAGNWRPPGRGTASGGPGRYLG